MTSDAALGRALAMVRDLRIRCPWDAAQTPHTLRPYLVEEALELDQAIASGNPVALGEELGDVLLHLAFQIVIAEEQGRLDAEIVTRSLEDKMKRRHPHLFGLGGKPESWEHGKREAGAGTQSVLSGLPPTLPPLMMAFRLQERAAGVGFDWPNADGPLGKVKEETAELERETGGGAPEAILDEIGDLLFAVVNLARKLGVHPSQALERANAKFTRRFEAVEHLAEERGVELGLARLEELDGLWQEVKRTTEH